MKSHSKPCVRWSNRLRARYALEIRALVARVFESRVRGLITSLVIDGLLAICNDLGLDQKDQDTIRRRGLCEENFLTVLLPRFGKAFDQALGNGLFIPPSGFKVRDDYPVFLGRYVRTSLDPESPERDRIEAVRVVRQVCFYAYKLDFPYSPELKDGVIASFLDTEVEVNRLNEELLVNPEVRDRRQVVQDLASNLICAVTDQYDRSRVIPKHGPGVTSNVEIHKKWSSPLSPGSSVGDLNSLYFYNDTAALDRINRFPTWKTRDYFAPKKGEIAKVVLVPKDSRGPRLISAEPAERQFIQQGIAGQLVDLLQSNPLSAGHVNFDDQSINQDMAIRASKTREWATLDLKDASDRVSLGLVHLLFGKSRAYSDILLARSSFTTLPNGTIVRLGKYAPMGSALCFPVLASVVWSLSVASLASAYGNLDRACSSVFVYGDDLVVPSELAHQVIFDLESFGLKVNRDKSFINSAFAESCGTDAFLGETVTPLRLKHLWNLFLGDKHAQAKACVSLAAHAAECKTRSYHSASEYYYSAVEQFLGPLPYATETSPYIGRIVPPSVWETHQNEWVARERNGWRSFSAFVIRTAKKHNPDDGPWEHIYRTASMRGSGKTVKLGEYDTPRKISLVRRKFKVSTLSCGVFPVPEWVKMLT